MLPEEAAHEYKMTLSELKSNNKTQINLLTILAEDYQKASAAIIDSIESHVYSVPNDQKLPCMYVCDSILKNVKKPNDYGELMAKKIVNIFTHVFQHGNETVRGALYKLRITWAVANVFKPSKLYQLDMKINQLDSAWPIANPTTGNALRNDPQVKPPVVKTPQSRSSNVHVNVAKFPEMNKDNDRTRKPIPGLKMAPPTAAPQPQKVIKKEVKKEIKRETIDPLDKLLPETKPTTSTSPQGQKRKAEPPRPQQSLPPAKKMDTTSDEDLRKGRDLDLRPKNIKPTSALGAHAFAVPPQSAPLQIPPIQAAMLPTAAPTTGAMGLPPPKPQVKHVYGTEGSKLEIPQNNRIFVEGKAYEVMFVDDSAVIERASVPHRIFFAGPPRNVVIDDVPHLLSFGETKLVDIGGQQHSIKFGAPSRELYMGGYPFKGQFGGPPIFATINGVRHSIRLTGTAPEVKIDPDPAYDLARFLNKMRAEKKVEIKAETPKPIEDPFTLLKKLQKNGFLKPLPQQQQEPAVRTPPLPPPQVRQEINRTPQRMPASSSAPALVTPGVERKQIAPSLKEFNLRLLKIRYDNVVDGLLKKRTDSCDICGLRLDSSNGKSKEWADHKDWHVQQNLKKSGVAKYRMWYPASTSWLAPKNNEVASGSSDSDEPKEVAGVASSGVKDCAICGDRFEEYYDQEEEMWRLKETVKVKGKIVHSFCAGDAAKSLQETPTPTSAINVSPFFVAKTEPMEYEDDVKPFNHPSSSSSSFDQKPNLNTLMGR